MPKQHYAFHFNLSEGCILFLSALTSFFLVFAFGVYIGKEVQAYKTAQETRTVRFPIHASEDVSRTPASPPSLPLVKKHRSKQAPQPHRLSSQPVPTPTPSPATRLREKARAAPQPVVSKSAVKPEIQKAQGTGSGSWSIQVHVTKKRRTAQYMAAELRRQGHAAAVNTITRHGEVWYRIRVGTFTQKEAQLLASRFRREGKFTQAFLVSD